jgi:site-specific recombinase XerD
MSTNTVADLTLPDDRAAAWQHALYAFLAEKERRSGSRRTVEGYARMVQYFFAHAGKGPDKVRSPEVLAYAHGIGLSGRTPSSVTVGARIACLSSFYRFLVRMGMVTGNPCDALERPRIIASPPRGYGGDDVRKLLAVVPDTVAGRRDRAIILTLVLTGRRRAEVINLKAGDITAENGTAFYSYRGKGGKRGRRELPRPAFDAIERSLADIGKTPAAMRAEESLWQAGASERGVTSATFYNRLRRYQRAAGVGGSGVHIFRHTAAKLRRDAGESVEQVSAFLDHSSLAVTTIYLRRLEGQEDVGWGKVAEAIGLQPISW